MNEKEGEQFLRKSNENPFGNQGEKRIFLTTKHP